MQSPRRRPLYISCHNVRRGPSARLHDGKYIDTLERVIAALEAKGIEFLGDPLTSPGVRLKQRRGEPDLYR